MPRRHQHTYRWGKPVDEAIAELEREFAPEPTKREPIDYRPIIAVVGIVVFGLALIAFLLSLLRQKRNELGMTQETLADALGVTFQQVPGGCSASLTSWAWTSHISSKASRPTLGGENALSSCFEQCRGRSVLVAGLPPSWREDRHHLHVLSASAFGADEIEQPRNVNEYSRVPAECLRIFGSVPFA